MVNVENAPSSSEFLARRDSVKSGSAADAPRMSQVLLKADGTGCPPLGQAWRTGQQEAPAERTTGALMVRATKANPLVFLAFALMITTGQSPRSITFCISVLRSITYRAPTAQRFGVCSRSLRNIGGFEGQLSFVRFRTNARDPRCARKVGGVHSTIVSITADARSA
jgi:hypothetical protein